MFASGQDASHRASSGLKTFHLVIATLVATIFLICLHGNDPNSPAVSFRIRPDESGFPAYYTKHAYVEPAVQKFPTGTLEAIALNGPRPFPPLPQADDEEYLAICMIVKDQSIDLPEFFIHYYHHHGVRRFYIYDDGSSPPLSTHPHISDYGIPESALTFIYINSSEVAPGQQRTDLQKDTYTRCVIDHKQSHTWLAFLDADEFLEMRNPLYRGVVDWLRKWETHNDVGALAVQWLSHTSNNHTTRPTTSARKAYTQCVANDTPQMPNRHIKSFVRTEYFSYFQNIHSVVTREGSMQVGEHGDQVTYYNRLPITHEYWALHHYATRSREDFDAKKARGRVQGPGAFVVDEGYWSMFHDGELHECAELAAYEP